MGVFEYKTNIRYQDINENNAIILNNQSEKAISNLSREKNVDAIVDYSIETSDNPIREKISINSALHNTLNNMDCNIDPIDNK